MIFNSISKQLNHQPSFQPRNYQPGDYQPTGQSRLTNSNYLQSSRMEKESSLSHMNQKIMNNIQYLRHKDVVRDNLKGSRVSSKSHASNRSYHSNRSLQRSTHTYTHKLNTKPHVVEVASKWRFNDVRTPEDQHYFPQKASAIKPEFSNWERPAHNNKMVSSSHLCNRGDQGQYREMLRKPITIEQYTTKYGLGKVQKKIPEKDNVQESQFKSFSKQNQDKMQFQMFKGNSGKEQTGRDSLTSPSNTEGRDWVHSFGQKFNSGTPVTAIQPESTKVAAKTQKSSFFSSSKAPAETLSPLPKSKGKKEGLIIAGVLIALGVMLLILQISK